MKILVQQYGETKGLDSRLRDHLEANEENTPQKLKEAKEQKAKAAEGEAQARGISSARRIWPEKGVDSKQAWEVAQCDGRRL